MPFVNAFRWLPSKHQVDADGRIETPTPVRRLAVSDHDLSDYSGVRMASNKSVVRFADDMAVLRQDDGLVVVAPMLTIEGDLKVEGTVYGAASANLGSTADTAAVSCRSILQLDSSARDGIYYITRLDAEEPYRAYCDMTRGGLELVRYNARCHCHCHCIACSGSFASNSGPLTYQHTLFQVFKITHGVGGDAVDLWADTDGHNEETKCVPNSIRWAHLVWQFPFFW